MAERDGVTPPAREPGDAAPAGRDVGGGEAGAPAGRDPGADVAALAARVAAELRSAGVPTGPEGAGRFAASLGLAWPARLRDLYWLGRVTLLTDPSHIPVWDAVFAQVFGGIIDPAEARQPRAPAPAPGTRRPAQGPPATAGGAPPPSPIPVRPGPNAEPGGDGSGVLLASSAEERLRRRDFAALSPEELDRLRALMADLAIAPPQRRARRLAPARRGGNVDLRATLRAAQRTGGDPIRLARRRRGRKPRRLVLICDISGSMEAYTRAYLQLLVSAVGGAGAEAFVFATRLTRLTHALRAGSPDAAIERAAAAAPDWSGGTRIGEALKEFNDRYGRPGMARGAVVVIVSDGWERADPALLGREVERLARLAHRLVWVNPRAASDRYQPLAAGMAAALPHVDAFVSGHSLEALDAVLAAISG